MTHRPDLASVANANWAPRTLSATPVTTWAPAASAWAPAASAWAFTASRDLLRAMFIWQARERERGALAALDERMLRDVGLTRTDVRVEVSKQFWER